MNFFFQKYSTATFNSINRNPWFCFLAAQLEIWEAGEAKKPWAKAERFSRNSRLVDRVPTCFVWNLIKKDLSVRLIYQMIGLCALQEFQQLTWIINIYCRAAVYVNYDITECTKTVGWCWIVSHPNIAHSTSALLCCTGSSPSSTKWLQHAMWVPHPLATAALWHEPLLKLLLFHTYHTSPFRFTPILCCGIRSSSFAVLTGGGCSMQLKRKAGVKAVA